MDSLQARSLLENILTEIEDSPGHARTQDFSSLRQVDAKVREASTIIESLPGFGERMLRDIKEDQDFEANSRRVRLEAIANYCRTAIGFINAGVMHQEKKQLVRAPDLTSLTTVMPDLENVIQARWLEAQKCQLAGAYIASVVMMGSILEALLLARANQSPSDAYRASAVPSRKGSQIPIHEWSLSSLIDVSAELGWIKMDRKAFSHALRDSRNVVHPWHQVQTGADFDLATCAMCWQVLKSSVKDLLESVNETSGL